MKSKLIKIFSSAIAVIVLFLAIAFLSLSVRNAKRTIERLESNIVAMQSSLERSISTDGKNVAESKAQTLTATELKKAIAEELKTINVKARDVKSVSTIQTNNIANVKTDTVILHDTVVEYRYDDEWITLRIDADSAHIACRDCLLVVNHCRTRKFLWWTIRRYSGKTTIKNYSPYSTVKTVEYVEVDKK